jgi:glycosyltransferase involved in cell wall biosynthesis
MKILFLNLVPIGSCKKMSRNSLWRVTSERAVGLAKLGHDVSVIIPEGADCSELGLEHCDVAVRKIFSYHMRFPSAELLKDADGDYDVIITTEPKIASLLNSYLSGEGTRVAYVTDLRHAPVVLSTPLYSFNESRPTERAKASHAWGILSSDSAFNSREQYRQWRDLAADVVRPSALRRMDERREIVTLSIPLENIQESRVSGLEETKVVRYAGRIDDVKGVEETLDISEAVRRVGGPVRSVVTTYGLRGSKYERDLRAKHPDVEWQIDLPMDDYYRSLSESHIFVCASKTDCFNIVNFESWSSGMVGVFWRRPWMKGVLPPDYPFIADTFEKTAAMTKWVAENFVEARGRIDWIQDYIRENHSEEVIASRLEDLLLRKVEENRALNERRIRRGPIFRKLAEQDEEEVDVLDLLNGFGMSKSHYVKMKRGISAMAVLLGYRHDSGKLVKKQEPESARVSAET